MSISMQKIKVISMIQESCNLIGQEAQLATPNQK